MPFRKMGHITVLDEDIDEALRKALYAKDILKGLKVYEGEISEGVDKTYAKVMSGLETFRQKMLELAEQAANNIDTDNSNEPDSSSNSRPVA